jgi:hypothetical protein
MAKYMAITVLLTATTLFAEINPRYYVEMQKKSPERLRIKVTQVKNEPCDNCETFKTEVTAVVTKAIRTKSKLKKGREVTFSYSVFRPRKGWAGPRPMPQLEQGKEYDFFGSKTAVDAEGRVELLPGARGYSFDSLVSED